MSITPQQWADWMVSPVTKAIIQELESKKESYIYQLVNLDIQQSAEMYGIQAIALRYQLDGIGEFLDLDNLAESVGVPINEN